MLQDLAEKGFSLSTKKIKGLHENDFIMASKIDRVLNRSGPVPRLANIALGSPFTGRQFSIFH
jgi:hypothetical protein